MMKLNGHRNVRISSKWSLGSTEFPASHLVSFWHITSEMCHKRKSENANYKIKFFFAYRTLSDYLACLGYNYKPRPPIIQTKANTLKSHTV